jgi:hypothetical protein
MAVDGLRDADMPGLYQAADAGSARGQRRYVQLTRARLFAMIIAAGAGVGSWTVQVGKHHLDLLAAMAIVAFGAAVLLEALLLQLRPERDWYDGRALAESAKTLAWRFAVGGEAFPCTEAADLIEQRFLARLLEIQQDEPGRDALVGSTAPAISDKMRWLRSQDIDTRRRAYLQDRIINQQNWYASKSRHNQTWATAWRFALIFLELAGLVWSVLRVADLTGTSGEGLVATIVAGGGAWLELRQHESLGRAYAITAQELSTVQSRIDRPFADEVEWAKAVDGAEEAISREHTMWRASRARV